MATSPELRESMRRHPSTSKLVDCPACDGLGLVTPSDRQTLIDRLVGRLTQRQPLSLVSDAG